METAYPMILVEPSVQQAVLKTLNVLLRVAHWVDKAKAVLAFAILLALFVIAVL